MEPHINHGQPGWLAAWLRLGLGHDADVFPESSRKQEPTFTQTSCTPRFLERQMTPIGKHLRGDHHVALNRIGDGSGSARGRVRGRGRGWGRGRVAMGVYLKTAAFWSKTAPPWNWPPATATLLKKEVHVN